MTVAGVSQTRHILKCFLLLACHHKQHTVHSWLYGLKYEASCSLVAGVVWVVVKVLLRRSKPAKPRSLIFVFLFDTAQTLRVMHSRFKPV